MVGVRDGRLAVMAPPSLSGDRGALARVRTRVAVLGLAVDLYGEGVVVQRGLPGPERHGQ